MQHENSWPFRTPVDKEKVRDYYDVIKKPMDLETIQKKVNLGLKEEADENGESSAGKKGKTDGQEGEELQQYTSVEEFKLDIGQMFVNAKTYNTNETIYYKYACQLEALIKPMANRLRDNNVRPV